MDASNNIPTFYGLTQAQMAEFINLYPTTRNEDLCERFGLSKYKIKVIRETLRDKHGILIAKTDEFMREQWVRAGHMGDDVNRRNGYKIQRAHMAKLHAEGRSPKAKKGDPSPWHTATEEQKAQWKAKMSARRQKVMADEKRRLMFGLEQRTKLNFVEQNRPRANAKWALINKFGYKFVEKWLFEYDGNTERKPKREQNYIKKFKFRFRQAENTDFDI